MSERRNDLKALAAAEDLAARLPGRDVTQITARWVENWGRINDQLVAMAQSSLRNSAAAVEELRQCQSPAEVVDTQIRLARAAYEDYLDEARQLSDLMAKLSSEAILPAGNAAGQSR
jgi:Phasin protein.